MKTAFTVVFVAFISCSLARHLCDALRERHVGPQQPFQLYIGDVSWSMWIAQRVAERVACVEWSADWMRVACRHGLTQAQWERLFMCDALT